MTDVVVWAADIGSIKNKKFGWCRADAQSQVSGHDIRELVSGVVRDLDRGRKVALGFECPLFVPITQDPTGLTSARRGEGDRAWSVGAGSGALATGLTETVWILEQIRLKATSPIVPTLRWQTFEQPDTNLFLWEAFVSGRAKGITHLNDAEIAALHFRQHLEDIPGANAVTAEAPHSLIGAALLRAKLATNVEVLFEPCVVVKADATSM